MRENRHFVRSTSISDFAPVLIDGLPAVAGYRTAIEKLEALAGRDAASLFAEPVFPAGVTTLGPALSWYCPYEGAAVAVDDIDEVARRPLAQKLSQRLIGLEPALRDPEIGGIIRSWLNISSPADILSIGGEPVLVNWGFLPKSVAADPSRRDAHFAETLGRFAPSLGFSSTPVQGNVTPDAAAPTSRPNAPGAGPSGVFVDGHVQTGGLPPAAAAIRGKPWLAPLIAAAVAAIILFILVLPGVLVYPADSRRSERDVFEEQRLRASNDSLEAQLKTLQDAGRERVCRLNDTPVPVPWLRKDGANDPQPPPRMELLPRAPDRVPLQRTTDADQGGAANVGELLDNATVLVLGLKPPNGASQGTGFFVSDRHIVTNHHVVQNIDAQNIFVASRAIGGIRHARLVAATQPPPSSQDIRADLAVLEIQPASNRAVLRIGTTPPKLSTAYVAGFPGFVTQRDVDFGNFLDQLSASLRAGNSDETLSRQSVRVPGADLKFGRVNNVMNTGSNEVPIIIHDMQLAPGNSGGPLVDACGRLGGVNTLLFTSDQGAQQANVAQDVSLLRKFLTENHIPFTSDDSACNPSLAKAADQPRDGSARPNEPPPTQSPSPLPRASEK